MTLSAKEPIVAISLITARELSEQTGSILHRVSEHGETLEIVLDGKIVARFEPRRPIDPDALAAWWAEWDELAAEIGAKWPKGVSAEEAIREIRREL